MNKIKKNKNTQVFLWLKLPHQRLPIITTTTLPCITTCHQLLHLPLLFQPPSQFLGHFPMTRYTQCTVIVQSALSSSFYNCVDVVGFPELTSIGGNQSQHLHISVYLYSLTHCCRLGEAVKELYGKREKEIPLFFNMIIHSSRLGLGSDGL